jgi:hypothetical protein
VQRELEVHDAVVVGEVCAWDELAVGMDIVRAVWNALQGTVCF